MAGRSDPGVVGHWRAADDIEAVPECCNWAMGADRPCAPPVRHSGARCWRLAAGEPSLTPDCAIAEQQPHTHRVAIMTFDEEPSWTAVPFSLASSWPLRRRLLPP